MASPAPGSQQAPTEPLIAEKNVAVRLRDGITLYANVFRPAGAERVPAILSVTPYGKDRTPDRLGMLLMRLSRVRFGRLAASRLTGFEAPDPVFWTAHGYAVAQADARGMHRSEGQAGVLSDTDALDYAELIAWVARQPWCSGAVGLCGVSYLAMSQWRVAPLRPPALKAIIPWEGVTDLYRELAFQGGIPETGFLPVWWKHRMKSGHNKRYAMAEDFLAERDAHPLDDAFWAGRWPNLEAIDVPALVCGSWSDQGLHTRGSFEGFSRIGSSQKWLFTHGRRKWQTFYSAEAAQVQLRFLDHFLKGKPNGWLDTPRVRLEVRRSLDRYDLRFEPAWPLPSVSVRTLHLDAQHHTLASAPPTAEAIARYDSTARSGDDRASFVFRFDQETELTGEMALKLWVSTSEGVDLDLFILLRKLDPAGREVHFYGYNGYDRDSVAKGWLRFSQRARDPTRSRPTRPWHTHTSVEPIAPGAIVPVEIEILPSSTAFEQGTALQLDILGHDPARYPAFRHERLVNRGLHSIHTGGSFDSQLRVPVPEGTRPRS